MDMTGVRGPASIAAALEPRRSTDQQKQNLLVAIADYMAWTRRAISSASRLADCRCAPARAGVAAAGGAVRGGTPATTAPITPADVQAAQLDAAKLRPAPQDRRPGKHERAGRRAPYAALDTIAPAQRLFSNP